MATRFSACEVEGYLRQCHADSYFHGTHGGDDIFCLPMNGDLINHLCKSPLSEKRSRTSTSMSEAPMTPSNRKYSVLDPPTCDEVFARSYMIKLREILDCLFETSGCATWAEPVWFSELQCAADTSTLNPESALANKWLLVLLKLHQVVASLFPFANSEETSTDEAKQSSASTSLHLLPSSGANADTANRIARQTNIAEVCSIWAAMAAVESQEAHRPTGHRYMDYHPKSQADKIDKGGKPSRKSTSVTTRVAHTSIAPTGDDNREETLERIIPRASVDWRAFSLYFLMAPGTWSAPSDPQLEETDPYASDDKIPQRGLREAFYWNIEEKKLVFIVDSTILGFSTVSHGRFDFYLVAILLSNFAHATTHLRLPYTMPACLLSLEMAKRRASHAVRICSEVRWGDYVSDSRYTWLLQMLTGSDACVNDALTDLSDDVWNSQFCSPDAKGTSRLERLCVGLLGHADKAVRSRATVLLTNLYDRHDWQKSIPFVPVVRTTGDRFFLEITIDHESDPATSNGPEDVFVILFAPSFVTTARNEVYSTHALHWRVPEKTVSSTNKARNFFRFKTTNTKSFRWTGTVDFGTFPRCGYYDWRVVRADPSVGSWQVLHSTLAEIRRSSSIAANSESAFCYRTTTATAPLDGDDPPPGPFSVYPNPAMWVAVNADSDELSRSIPLQGRFIVQQAGARDEQIHEIFVDEHGAVFTDDQLTTRGTFSSVSASLGDLREQGITTVQLLGSAARDNGDLVYRDGRAAFEREGASPYAITCRATPNEMLGGHDTFSSLMNESQRVGIKVLIDIQARVSSARAHRKYSPYTLQSLDDEGKRSVVYGTDGFCVRMGESCLLNYRNADTWKLLLDDIMRWVNEYNVDGVKLDNSHSWPTIMVPRDDELTRRDPDGERHYTSEQQLLGEVIYPHSETCTGFWTCSAADNYPNPLYVKLCRALWRRRSSFMIVGDVGTVEACLGDRPGVMARSGLIPRLQGLPDSLSKLYGKKLIEGRVENLKEPCTIWELKDWFDHSHMNFPEGGISIQSSCSSLSPYPSLLYGRGAWPAVDLLFFMPSIPLTIGGELEGKGYRLDVPNVLMTQQENLTTVVDKVDFNPRTAVRRQPSGTLRSALNLKTSQQAASPLSRIRGLNSFESPKRLVELEQAHVKNTGPEFGFDLAKISKHYEHRRRLRHLLRILRVGSLLPLRATGPDAVTPHDRVLAFARFDEVTGEFVVVVINFGETELKDVHVSLKGLSRSYFSMSLDATAIFEYVDLFELPTDFGKGRVEKSASDLDLNAELFGSSAAVSDSGKGVISLAELVSEPQVYNMKPYGSICYGFKIICSAKRNPDVLRRLFTYSVGRFDKLVTQACGHEQSELPRHLRRAISNNLIYQSIFNAVRRSASINPLADVLHNLTLALDNRKDISSTFYTMLVASGLLYDKMEPLVISGQGNAETKQQTSTSPMEHFGATLFAKLQRIVRGSVATVPETTSPAASAAEDTPAKACGAVRLAKHVLAANCIGPIVFVTAELGKWSTVGGLGVMVDELSCTLAQEFGQEVWVISPYYDRNRKGEQGYMARDDITYKFNIEVVVGGEKITLGVHEGNIRGVRLLFMHNARFFPHPYPDMNAAESLYYLTVLGKGALELLCHFRQIPQLLVTNDWPTGLTAAFAKQGHFGDAFQNTTFFHIVHNLDPAYEGRLYPDRRQDLSWIPGLPSNMLVDPAWSQYVYNPSRAALLASDAWGTVSTSYRNELVGEGGARPSPLAPLLKRFNKVFAFPNGIPIKSREALIQSLNTPDHLAAKEYIQKKYFGFEKGAPEIPLFAFIGRITEQKGVHLITEAAESVIPRYNSKIQFLVGGMVNWRDPYSARVGRHLQSLRDRYPWSFWAAPNDFFTDGPLINVGADFGLMPSAFEPGGIVQHEFFVAGTPVIAFCTGGLKDTVFEYNPESGRGNGMTFLSYSVGDLLFAIERASRVYGNEEQYKQLRSNAKDATMSSHKVADAWLHEFCRLRQKVALNPEKVKKVLSGLPVWSEERWLQRHRRGSDYSFNAASGFPAESEPSGSEEQECQHSTQQRRESRLNQKGPIPSGPPPLASVGLESAKPSVNPTTSATSPSSSAEPTPPSSPTSHDTSPTTASPPAAPAKTPTVEKTSCPVTIRWTPSNAARRPRGVAISGSFDNWAVRRPMTWDPAQQAFVLNLAVPPKKHHYKLIVDGVWMVNTNDQTETDASGNVNNVLSPSV